MSMKTLVNLPVKDLSRSTRFFTTLGFSFNQQFTDENTTCMIIGDDTYVILTRRRRSAQIRLCGGDRRSFACPSGGFAGPLVATHSVWSPMRTPVKSRGRARRGVAHGDVVTGSHRTPREPRMKRLTILATIVLTI